MLLYVRWLHAITKPACSLIDWSVKGERWGRGLSKRLLHCCLQGLQAEHGTSDTDESTTFDLHDAFHLGPAGGLHGCDHHSGILLEKPSSPCRGLTCLCPLLSRVGLVSLWPCAASVIKVFLVKPSDRYIAFLYRLVSFNPLTIIGHFNSKGSDVGWVKC